VPTPSRPRRTDPDPAVRSRPERSNEPRRVTPRAQNYMRSAGCWREGCTGPLCGRVPPGRGHTRQLPAWDHDRPVSEQLRDNRAARTHNSANTDGRRTADDLRGRAGPFDAPVASHRRCHVRHLDSPPTPAIQGQPRPSTMLIVAQSMSIWPNVITAMIALVG
jgi:hypothetical protein